MKFGGGGPTTAAEDAAEAAPAVAFRRASPADGGFTIISYCLSFCSAAAAPAAAAAAVCQGAGPGIPPKCVWESGPCWCFCCTWKATGTALLHVLLPGITNEGRCGCCWPLVGDSPTLSLLGTFGTPPSITPPFGPPRCSCTSCAAAPPVCSWCVLATAVALSRKVEREMVSPWNERMENASNQIGETETGRGGLPALAPFGCWPSHRRCVRRLLCFPHEEFNWQQPQTTNAHTRRALIGRSICGLLPIH